MNYRELAVAAVARWRQYHGNESLYLQCQRFSGYYMQWVYQGNENIHVYGSAALAADNSAMYIGAGGSVNDPRIQGGDEIFFEWGSEDDVVTVIGRDGGRTLVASTGRTGDNFEDLGNHVFVAHADTIQHPLRGISHSNGRNIPKSGLDLYLLGQPTLAPFQRQVGPNGVYRRQGPSTAGPAMEEFPPGDVLDFRGWVYGEDPYGDGRNIWFKGRYSETWFWSGAFTDQGTHDLADLNAAPPAPAPTTPQYPIEKYTFEKAGDFVTRVAPADWSNFENEYSEPDPAKRKGFPAKPTKVVIHQWDDPAKNPRIEGVIAKAQGRSAPGGEMSPHLVIDNDNTVQTLPLQGVRGYHAGPGGNDFYGFECDPDMEPATILRIREALEFLRDQDGYVHELELHRNVAATACGFSIAPHLTDLDITKPYPPVLTPDPPVPEPIPEPNPEPPVEPGKSSSPWGAVISAIIVVIGAAIAALVSLFQ